MYAISLHQGDGSPRELARFSRRLEALRAFERLRESDHRVSARAELILRRNRAIIASAPISSSVLSAPTSLSNWEFSPTSLPTPTQRFRAASPLREITQEQWIDVAARLRAVSTPRSSNG